MQTARKANTVHDQVSEEEITRKLLSCEPAEILEVYYQPQIDLRTGLCHHVESLVRWNDPEFGFVSPAVFVPMLEELGLIWELTKFVIQQSAADISDWERKGTGIDSVAINISAKLFSNEAAARELVEFLMSLETDPSSIILELTETAMVQHEAIAFSSLSLLSTHGFRIALDDFGTGYSSLAYLLAFPVSTIKIDRCFTSKLTTSEKCIPIFQSVLSLASALSLSVVAEGAETAEEVEILRGLGCHHIQGFFFGKAMPRRILLSYVNTLSNSVYEANEVRRASLAA